MNTINETRILIYSPKSDDEDPRPFYIGVPPSSVGGGGTGVGGGGYTVDVHATCYYVNEFSQVVRQKCLF